MSELFSEESKKKFISEVGYGSSREIRVMLTICKYCNITDDLSVYSLESESNKMLCLYGHLQKHYNSYNPEDWDLKVQFRELRPESTIQGIETWKYNPLDWCLFRSLECPWVSYFLRKNYYELVIDGVWS